MIRMLLNSNRTLMLLQAGVACCCGYFVLYSLTDADIFWHLAAGREIFAKKAVLHNDLFSYTVPFARWIDVHWLYQVGVYLIEKTGGGALLLMVKACSVSAAVLLLFAAFKKNRFTLIVWLITGVVIYRQRYLIPMRPIVASLLCISAIIALMEQYCKTGKRRLLAVAAVVQIIWTNCQGLFLMGPVVAAAYGAGELTDRLLYDHRFRIGDPRAEMSPRRLSGLLALPVLLAAASLVNPYGWRALAFAFSLFTRLDPSAGNIYSRMIVENMPLPAMVGTGYRQYAVTVAVLFLLLLFSMALARRSLRTAHVLCAGAGVVLAWMAQRNGILFTFLALPGLLWNAGNIRFSQPGTKANIAGILTVVSAAAVTVGAVVNHTRTLLLWPHTLSPFSYPTQTTPLLAGLPPQGHLFNADRYGGYLIWKLFPDRQVSSDTRLTMRSRTYFEEYVSLIEYPERFDAYAKRWNISCVVLPVAPVELYLKLAVALYRNPRWRQVFTDGTEVLFCSDTLGGRNIDLNSKETVDTLFESLQVRYSGSPRVLDEAWWYLGRWCAAAGASDGAIRVLRECKNPGAKVQLAAVEAQSGLADAAEKTLLSVIEAYPRYLEARFALTMLYLHNGRRGDGLRQLERLLKKDPFNKRARNILFTMSRK